LQATIIQIMQPRQISPPMRTFPCLYPHS